MATSMKRSRGSGRAKGALAQLPSDIARRIHKQEHWTEEEYLALDADIGAWMIELVDGRLEVLPMPTPYHQDIVIFLLLALREFVMPRRAEYLQRGKMNRVAPDRDVRLFEYKSSRGCFAAFLFRR